MVASATMVVRLALVQVQLLVLRTGAVSRPLLLRLVLLVTMRDHLLRLVSLVLAVALVVVATLLVLVSVRLDYPLILLKFGSNDCYVCESPLATMHKFPFSVSDAVHKTGCSIF